MVAQVADVSTALGSVHKMVEMGNVVHFESGNCYIMNPQTGRVTPIEEKGGAFEVGIWIPTRDDGQTPGFPGPVR